MMLPQALFAPDAVEYAVRLADGTILRDGDLTSRFAQEDRLRKAQASWPDAVLIERPVWYGEWDPVP